MIDSDALTDIDDKVNGSICAMTLNHFGIPLNGQNKPQSINIGPSNPDVIRVAKVYDSQ